MGGVAIDPGGEGILGGGGCGGVGSGRPGSTSGDHHGGHTPMPKMPFPRFDGVHPRIWRDKCHDYFRAFSISPMLWLTTVTLHMDGNVAIWLQSYKQRHTLGQWPQFIAAVEAEFGADDQRQSLKSLLNLTQHGSVDEYYREFQTLRYQVSMYNPNYDENFFISQFIKGLKAEIREAVESHIPDTLERAVLLARVQQEISEANKTCKPKAPPYTRTNKPSAHSDVSRPTLKSGTGDLWKDRQLRDYRKSNGLCFKCGDKFDPSHQCGQKPVANLNALETEICPLQLSKEALNLMEIHDLAEAQQLSLSLNALAGLESSNCLRLRAMVGNQVMIILVDSGSNSSFINTHMLPRIQCEITDVPPIPVKLANGEFIYTSKMVPELTWWSHGATFTTPMRVLDMGGYDAILGIDWLKRHSPMVTDWEKKFLSFPYKGQQVTLHGVANSEPSVNSPWNNWLSGLKETRCGS
jgi:hypothetical protein